MGVLYEPESRTHNGEIRHGNAFYLSYEVAELAVGLLNEIFAKGKKAGVEFTKEEVRDAVRMKFSTIELEPGSYSFTRDEIKHCLAENPMEFLVSFPGKPPQKPI
jgi:hypothetical protein